MVLQSRLLRGDHCIMEPTLTPLSLYLKRLILIYLVQLHCLHITVRSCGENYMSIIKNVGVHGLLVPDVPLEKTEILRKEAQRHQIELVLLTTPTTLKERMNAIVEASEGFIYLEAEWGADGVIVGSAMVKDDELRSFFYGMSAWQVKKGILIDSFQQGLVSS